MRTDHFVGFVMTRLKQETQYKYESNVKRTGIGRKKNILRLCYESSHLKMISKNKIIVRFSKTTDMFWDADFNNFLINSC